MVRLEFLAICAFFGRSFGDETCDVSLPPSDPRSSKWEASQSDNTRSKDPLLDNVQLQADPSSHHNNFMISWSEYRRAWRDASTKKKYKSSIPILREAAKSWKNAQVYIDLCAVLINYGHSLVVLEDVKAIYNEAEMNCKMALAFNNNYSHTVNENLEALRSSRQIRGIEGKQNMRKKKPDVKTENGKGRFKADSMALYEELRNLAKPLRISSGPIDDGNLEFSMYNGSISDPSSIILRLGEVYVEDNFISEEERRVLIEIVERGLPYNDKSGDKGPKGAVKAGPLTTLGSQLSKEERVVVARVRMRVINRANDLKGLDTSMWNKTQGVRSHATAFIRYVESGKHDIHHDNDFLNRCLSSSIVLNDDFEGGDFNLHTTKNEKEWNLKGFPIIGSVKGKPRRLALFLSNSMHSVSEVVSGNRDVFFVWCTCDINAEYQLDAPLEPVEDSKPWVASI